MGRNSADLDSALRATPRPALADVLRALRTERGISQEGWSARLGVSRKTVQRWEWGEVVPDAAIEPELIACCRERALFQTYEHGPLRGVTLTAELLSDLLAEGRHAAARRGRPRKAARSGVTAATADTAAVAPATSAEIPPGNLPLAITSFVGRGQELAQLGRLLEQSRLITLTGAGGVGKTRLALELAHRMQAQFPAGVRLVELASLSDPALVPRAVAAACAVTESAGRALTDLLIDRLRDVATLIVLDNCEHLVSACAALVATLLRACPRLHMLATSRQPLGVAGENVWRVPPLSLPDAGAHPAVALEQSEAAQLFVIRAQSARADAALTARDTPAVVAICRRLDGIPLALELAAARTRALSLEQVAERLEASFQLLSGGVDALPRHQTMRAAIDWSYDLLAPAEQTLFRRLSIFAGGFTLAAAEAVCAAPSVNVLECLIGLVDKSLVMMEPGWDGEAWYRLVEPVRQYAGEKLDVSGEVTWLGDRHRDWYLALAEEQGAPGLKGAHQSDWLTRLDLQHDNIRAALRWTMEHGPAEHRLRLVSAMTDFWIMRSYFGEGLEWAEMALASPESRGADPRRLAGALDSGGLMALRHGAYPRSRTLLEECLDLAREIEDPILTGRSLNHLGILARDQGDLDGAQRAWDACLEVFERLADQRGIAVARNNLAVLARDRGAYDLAGAHAEAVLAIDRERHDERGISTALYHLGMVALERDDLSRAADLLEESLSLRRKLGYTYGLVSSLASLGVLASIQGDFARAEPLFAESLSLASRHDYRQGQAQTLRAFGAAAHDDGDPRAAAFLTESLALARELGNKVGMIEALAGLSSIAQSGGDLDRAEALADESLVLAKEMGFRKGTAAASIALAATIAARGDAQRAAACYRHALIEVRELDSIRGIATCFERVAALQASFAGERSVRLLATAAALRERIGVPIPRRERPLHDDLVATLRAGLGDRTFASAQAAGRATPLQLAVEEVLGELTS